MSVKYFYIFRCSKSTAFIFPKIISFELIVFKLFLMIQKIVDIRADARWFTMASISHQKFNLQCLPEASREDGKILFIPEFINTAVLYENPSPAHLTTSLNLRNITVMTLVVKIKFNSNVFLILTIRIAILLLSPNIFTLRQCL